MPGPAEQSVRLTTNRKTSLTSQNPTTRIRKPTWMNGTHDVDGTFRARRRATATCNARAAPLASGILFPSSSPSPSRRPKRNSCALRYFWCIPIPDRPHCCLITPRYPADNIPAARCTTNSDKSGFPVAVLTGREKRKTVSIARVRRDLDGVRQLVSASRR